MKNNIENLLNNEDIVKVANNAAKSFRGCLSKDEIQNCIVNAIWEANKKYKSDGKAKFTSYLHTGVKFQCLSQKKFNNNKKKSSLNPNIEEKTNHFASIDMLDTINEVCDDPQLIIDRFYKDMTVSEIAKNTGVSGESIRTRLKKNMEKLRMSLEKSV